MTVRDWNILCLDGCSDQPKFLTVKGHFLRVLIMEVRTCFSVVMTVIYGSCKEAPGLSNLNVNLKHDCWVTPIAIARWGVAPEAMQIGWFVSHIVLAAAALYDWQPQLCSVPFAGVEGYSDSDVPLLTSDIAAFSEPLCISSWVGWVKWWFSEEGFMMF
jgi:hypothetical protein